jgi:hypothetical protein
MFDLKYYAYACKSLFDSLSYFIKKEFVYFFVSNNDVSFCTCMARRSIVLKAKTCRIDPTSSAA